MFQKEFIISKSRRPDCLQYTGNISGTGNVQAAFERAVVSGKLERIYFYVCYWRIDSPSNCISRIQ